MELTRRDFSRSIAGLIAIGAVAPARALTLRPQMGDYFDWRPVGEGAWAAFGAGGNALLVVSGGEALLIDCKNAGYGDTLRRESAERGGRLAAVVNTHHHGDHSGGNEAFTDDLPLYAHENARERIVRSAQGVLERLRAGGEALAHRMINQALESAASEQGGKRASSGVRRLFDQAGEISPDAFAPTRTIDGNSEIRIGALTAELRHAGPAHTDNDVFIVIPELNILHTGDLLFHKLHPFIDMNAGADSAGWIRLCDAMLEVCDDGTVVVPGHGEITDASGIIGQRTYLERVRETMAGAAQRGMSREEAIAVELPEFAEYGFDRMKPRTFGAIYDEMARE